MHGVYLTYTLVYCQFIEFVEVVQSTYTGKQWENQYQFVNPIALYESN